MIAATAGECVARWLDVMSRRHEREPQHVGVGQANAMRSSSSCDGVTESLGVRQVDALLGAQPAAARRSVVISTSIAPGVTRRAMPAEFAVVEPDGVPDRRSVEGLGEGA